MLFFLSEGGEWVWCVCVGPGWGQTPEQGHVGTASGSGIPRAGSVEGTSPALRVTEAGGGSRLWGVWAAETTWQEQGPSEEGGRQRAVVTESGRREGNGPAASASARGAPRVAGGLVLSPGCDCLELAGWVRVWCNVRVKQSRSGVLTWASREIGRAHV